MPPLETVLAKFPDAKQQPNGEYKALCPAHDDKMASLSIGEGNNSRAILKCHAGCANADIVAAVGLTLADLMPPKEARAPTEKWEEVPGSREFDCAYDYTDADGELLYQSVRFRIKLKNAATGEVRTDKTFSQRRKAKQGEPNKYGFVSSMKGVELVLYRLPDVLKAAQKRGIVYLVEGEKDAAAVASLGFVATTNVGGAAVKSSKWKPEYSEALRGAHIVILPDNDQAGKKHGQEVAVAVHGIAASVRVVELPNLPIKGDVSDWIAAGGTATELHDLAKAAPKWEKPPGLTIAENDAGDIPQAAGKDGMGRAVYEPWQIVSLLRNLPGYTWEVEAPDTNRAHAARIAMFLRNELCFCSQLGWLRWNGKHWGMDDKENTAAAALSATLASRVREEAAYLLGLAATLTRAGREADANGLLKSAKDLLKHVRQVETYSFIEASLSFAADLLRVQWEVFTPKPWIFGFDNGVWDKGEWREHRQSDYMLSVSPVAYLPDADRSEWLAVLERMTGKDSDLARTLQEFAGYCVSGASHLRLLPWAYGPRGTGKSTYAELLATLLGEEAAAMEPEDFGEKSRERMGAKIWNKRLAFCGEAGEQRLAAETLKQLSGGDTLPVRYLFKEAFNAKPHHVLLMMANDPPIMNAYDDALKSRVKVLPLVHDLSLPEPFTLTGGARIEAVRQLPESPLVIGFSAWVLDGLATVSKTQSVYLAPVVQKSTAKFWQDTDTLTGFWETIDAGALDSGIAKGELRRLYEEWCDREGIRRPLSRIQWTKACSSRGLEEWRRMDADRTRCWRTAEISAKTTDATDATDVVSKKSYDNNKSLTWTVSENVSVASVASVEEALHIPKGSNRVTAVYDQHARANPLTQAQRDSLDVLCSSVQEAYKSTDLRIGIAYGRVALFSIYGQVDSFWAGPKNGKPVFGVDPWEPAPGGLFREPAGGWSAYATVDSSDDASALADRDDAPPVEDTEE